MIMDCGLRRAGQAGQMMGHLVQHVRSPHTGEPVLARDATARALLSVLIGAPEVILLWSLSHTIILAF